MNLRNIFGSFFGGKSGALRNKPGGMAWINASVDEGCGAIQLVNRVVKTVRLKQSGAWEIEPPQHYKATHAIRFTLTGDVYRAGEWICIGGVADSCLTPIPGDLCSDSEVRELYAPKPTAKELA